MCRLCNLNLGSGVFRPLNLFSQRGHSTLNTSGVVKKYLRDHCNYSFELKENFKSTGVGAHTNYSSMGAYRLFCWVDGYWAGLGSVEAQIKVK